ncbi:MAG: alkaline phosphatase D family protein [Mycobacterium sp.]|nr:alkaline phosphatase D family protein [Mycobacterium sp.]
MLRRSLCRCWRAPPRAFHEYTPVRPEPAEPGRVNRRIAYGPLVDVFMLDMRSYSGPNGENKQTAYGPGLV